MQWIAEPKMDYEKLINCLERKTADTHELQAASAIIGLRQRVQELEKERADLMQSIHDQADRYDALSQELELSDALQRDKVAKLTAERDAMKKLYESSEESVLSLKETRNRLAEERDELLAAIALAIPVMDAHAGPSRLADFHAAIASVKEK